MTSVLKLGADGRESSVCAGANFSPPHSAMRLLLQMCQEVPVCPAGCKRDCVARTPMVTISSAIVTMRALPAACARNLPRWDAFRAIRSKLSTPAGICQETLLGPILHQIPVDRTDNGKGPPQSPYRQNVTLLGSPAMGKGCPNKNKIISQPAGDLLKREYGFRMDPLLVSANPWLRPAPYAPQLFLLGRVIIHLRAFNDGHY